MTVVRAQCGDRDWGFESRFRTAPGRRVFESCQLQGRRTRGSTPDRCPADQADALARHRNLNNPCAGSGGDTYWRLDEPNVWVRPTTTPALRTLELSARGHPIRVFCTAPGCSARTKSSATSSTTWVLQRDIGLRDVGPAAYGGATNVHIC